MKMGAFSYAHEKEDVYKLIEATRQIFQNNKNHNNIQRLINKFLIFSP